MSERIDLQSAAWQLAGFLPREASAAADGEHADRWFDITFPATVRHAHRAAGRALPDDWAQREWWYRCRFPRPGGKDRVVRLQLVGVDYHEITWLNGDRLGEDKGAFGPADYDISNSLADDNELIIRVQPAVNAQERMLTPNRSPLRWENPGEPRFDDVGVWDAVRIFVSGPAYFDGWLVRGELDGERGDVSVRLEVNNTQKTTQAEIRISVLDGGREVAREEFSAELATGENTLDRSVYVDAVKPWFPHTHGEPHRYTLRAELRLGGGVVDSLEQVFGVRTIRVQRAGDAAKLWRTTVNDREVFLQGINWAGMPLPPGLTYDDMVGRLKDGGVNAVRVWGGRHPDAFYEACDRLGILVLQEFPYALLDGRTYPRATPDFPAAREIPVIARGDNANLVRHIRNHPCIFLWVGGTRVHNRDNAHVMRLVEDALRTQDGTRPYIPVFPTEGVRLDTEIRVSTRSPEHFEDAPRLLIAAGLPAWDGEAPPADLPKRWKKYGGDAAQARAIAWAAGAQRTEETAGGFVGEVIDWHPDGGYGLHTFRGEPRTAWSTLAGLYAPQAAGLRFAWKRHTAGSLDCEVWAAGEGNEAKVRVKVTGADGASDGVETTVPLRQGLGEADFQIPLRGTPPLTAWVSVDGGREVPYPLDAAKPPSSASVAELHALRSQLAVQAATYRPLRDIGIYGLLPVELLLQGLFALRLAIGV